ncbi:MAG: HAD family hydrolase [Megasphaera sp.]|jgi:phosphoglycolate phosphatase|nr:HAD family hydrolase [Megasphaera sp.]MCH4188608.1 HAD family hydrolase [Megasphaera sp.]MCH4218268.1 HAD family hydrolase [Megasphaera sp.]
MAFANMMKHYKAIIFDMDGTVLNTLDELTHSLNHVFQHHDLPAKTALEVRKCLGYGYTGLIERAAGNVTPALQDRLADEFRTYYGAHCQGTTFPYDGIPHMLEQLRQAGYKMAIVSNKGQAAVSELHHEFFQGLVDFSMGESPEYRKKPAPDMVWEALKRCGVSKNDAIYIGDSEVDRKTAANAGLDSILVTWGFRDRPFLETLGADHLVDSVPELTALFL